MLDTVDTNCFSDSVYGLNSGELEERLKEMLGMLYDATCPQKIQAHAVLMRVKETSCQDLADGLEPLWGACVILAGGAPEHLRLRVRD